MKHIYDKVVFSWNKGPTRYAYDNRFSYYRKIKTFQEIARNVADYNDADVKENSVKGIERRCNRTLDSWNVEARARNGGASWKDYTRHRKQWGVGFDKKAIPWSYKGEVPAYRKPSKKKIPNPRGIVPAYRTPREGHVWNWPEHVLDFKKSMWWWER